jgi:acyl-CoA thioester hydrolase
MHDVWETRVRYAEVDGQEVVFYGNYFTYQDETFMAFLRAIEHDWLDLDGWEMHVVHADLDYRGQARFGDELVCGMRATAIGTASITFEWRCRTRDGRLCAEGEVVHVAVDDNGEKIRIPDDFREAVVAYQEEPPELRG